MAAGIEATVDAQMGGPVPSRLAEIAEVLETEVFQRIRLTAPSVFLVGASRSAASSLRDQVRADLAGRRRIPDFDIYYPEELFEELLRGGEAGVDLLELENQLAEHVHAVVILLESPGAIAELGAFANHDRLQNRLVVVVNSKHRSDRSFLMLGPVNFLRRKTQSQVIFHKLEDADLKKLGRDIRTAILKVSKDVVVDAGVQNPLAAQHYIRAAVHVLQPVSKPTLEALIQRVTHLDDAGATRIVSMCISILRKDGEVALGSEGFSLTEAGSRRMQEMLQREREGRRMVRAHDRARIDVLTWRLRRSQKLTA